MILLVMLFLRFLTDYEIIRFLLLVMLCVLDKRWEFNLIGEFSFYRRISYFLVVLVYLIRFIVIRLSCNESNHQVYKWINTFIMIVIVCFFYSGRLVEFYVWFEIRLLPISLVIMGWGYQPERLRAFINILLYTIVCSLPLLLLILWFSSRGVRRHIPWINNVISLGVVSIGLILGFLVKFPIFYFHIWLPKAHVEAPVGGSMVLAAILLKLAGFGVLFLGRIGLSRRFSMMVIRFALIGGLIIRVICVRQVDRKILVAYSSVAHIALVIGRIIRFSRRGIVRGYLIIFAHGVRSSAIFYLVYLVYLYNDRRNLILTKSMLLIQPRFTLILFVIIARNMGAPPFFNLFAELWRAWVIGRFMPRAYRVLGGLFFFSVVFNLIMYIYIRHGQSSSAIINVRGLRVMRIFRLIYHRGWTVLRFSLVRIMV